MSEVADKPVGESMDVSQSVADSDVVPTVVADSVGEKSNTPTELVNALTSVVVVSTAKNCSYVIVQSLK